MFGFGKRTKPQMSALHRIAAHSPDYRREAWKEYTLEELSQWVTLFLKRAGHRNSYTKRRKDILDAQNYFEMMKSAVDTRIAALLRENLP